MKKLLFYLLFLPIYLIAQDTNDQAIFTIHIGTFISPQVNEFDALAHLGYLYATPCGDNSYKVFIGAFNTTNTAKLALDEVKRNGYDAYIIERMDNQGKIVPVIQVQSKHFSNKFDWNALNRIGKLYVMVDDPKLVKIITGPFANKAAARKRVQQIKQMGYKDAFVKDVNYQLLSEIDRFEQGLQPLTSSDKLANEIEKIANDNASVTYKTPSSNIIIPKGTKTPKEFTTPVLPQPINPKVKRTAALDIQKILKTEGYYMGSLDGYYGTETEKAYQAFLEKDYQYNKYKLLANYIESESATPKNSTLQISINQLPYEAGAILNLEQSKEPIAKAYLAYWLLANEGPSVQVNRLMNAAIQETFSNKKLKNAPPFDFNASYAYDNLEQLFLHLRYLHAAPNTEWALPCWIFTNHPKEANIAFSKQSKFASLTKLKIDNCQQFDKLPPIKTLQTYLSDLQPATYAQEDIDRQEELQTGRALLYLFPEKLTVEQKKQVDQWKLDIWKSLETVANRNPLLAKYYPSMQVLFFQSQLLIEDYFMQKGFSANEAEGLALSILNTYMEVPLKAYFE